jgi:hypothetical protein
MSLMLLWWLGTCVVASCGKTLAAAVAGSYRCCFCGCWPQYQHCYYCDIWLLTQLWRSDPTAVAFVVAVPYTFVAVMAAGSYHNYCLTILGPTEGPEVKGPTTVIILVAVGSYQWRLYGGWFLPLCC